MSFYHFESSRASVNKDEPVWTTKFVTTWVLPDPLKPIYGTELIVQQIKKVDGLNLDFHPGIKEQKHRAHPRYYLGTQPDLKVEMEMEFEVNVDAKRVMYPYNIFKAWSRLGYDPQNAYQAMKKDYTGSLTIEIHTKGGDVLRKIYFPIIMLSKALSGWNLEYANEGIYTLKASFLGENPKDLIIGGSQ